ncbi:MAG: DUF2059 domain-containing protein [Pseudomonadaceae bacterium]|nr:MAG: DUF2059 domain-containing protein [Pseudomonadaceae bacterium]
MRSPHLQCIVRTLICCSLLGLSSLALAASEPIYQASGMQQHQAHFQQALRQAQERYARQLPTNVHQTLVRQSNQRFAPEAMQDRALARLAVSLDNPTRQQALDFYQQPHGQRIVTAETAATAPGSVASLQNGVPEQTLSAQRQALLARLANSLPALEMGVEVSMALANLAAQSANDLFGGLMRVPDAMVSGQRDRLRNQMQPNLLDTLAHTYRDLSDADLDAYANWSESETGQRYFRAVEMAARDALNP